MCVITSIVGATGTAFVIASLAEAAVVAGGLSATVTAAMGGSGKDILKSGLIGAGFGLAGGAAGALGGAIAGSAFGTAAGTTAGTAAGTATGEGTGMLASAASTATASSTTIGTVAGSVSGVTGAVTTTASGLQNIQEAEAEREYLNKKANLENAKAQQALDNAQLEKMDMRKKQRMLQGQGRVAAAANGVMIEGDREESLASMWETDVAIEGAYDRAKVQHNADMEAWGYRQNAKLMREHGNNLVKQAKKNFTTSIWTGLGTTAVGAFGSAFASGAIQAASASTALNPSYMNPGADGLMRSTDSVNAGRLIGGAGLRVVA